MENDVVSRFKQCQEKRTGFEGNLTPQQAEVLKEVKNRLAQSKFAKEASQQLDGDRFFLRFLRAEMKDKNGQRIFDADAGYERLIKQYEWRKEYDIDSFQKYIDAGVHPEGFERFRAIYPSLDLVNPENGEVMRIGYFGKFINTLDTKAYSDREWVRWFSYDTLYIMHVLRRESEKHQREISTFHSIPDVSGVSLVGVMQRIQFIQMMATVTGLYFPELIQTNYFVRAPWFFSKVASLAKPFLDKDTVSKFVMCSDVPSDIFATIMPTALLPSDYGGSGEKMAIPYFAQTKS